MDQKQISNIESGRARARLSTYLRIANVFDVSIDHFLAEALLVDLNDLPNSALSRKSEQRFLRDVILALLNYLKRNMTSPSGMPCFFSQNILGKATSR